MSQASSSPQHLLTVLHGAAKCAAGLQKINVFFKQHGIILRSPQQADSASAAAKTTQSRFRHDAESGISLKRPSSIPAAVDRALQ